MRQSEVGGSLHMLFVSFAQNQEDVMLRRALAGVDRGFYIDVGAQDPVHHSVTKAFYDRGWSGINVEPSEEYFQRLVRERPRDTNVQAVASDSRGRVSFFEIPGTGLSTMSSELKARHTSNGYGAVERTVDSLRLDDLCEQAGVSDIHFLKVDVEGAEKLVLRGISLDRFRPWIVLVEANSPLTDHPTHEEWEPILTGAGYRFVYFDGLNRFYLADERAALAEAFRSPPGIDDRYVAYTRRKMRFLLRVLKRFVAVEIARAGRLLGRA